MLRQYTSSTFSYPSSAAPGVGTLHANHSSVIPRPAAGQPIFTLERARVTRTCAGRKAGLGVGPSAGAKRRMERVWRVARRAAPESNALDRSAAGIVAVSAGGVV
jgi:hypothetical protein